MMRVSLMAGIAMVAVFGAITGAANATTAYDFAFDKIDGGPLPMSDFKGKTVLVVNTASFCGYTPQYKQLEAMWKAYRDKGVKVTTAQVLKANPTLDANKLYVGKKIFIPDPAAK